MFTSLRIENFKAWRDTGVIRLAPLTVLFGPNSSGKTSIIQFLLMLKQTIESPDRNRVLHSGDRTTPVDLGTFRDFVFRHDVDLPLSFRLSCDLTEPLCAGRPPEPLMDIVAISLEASIERYGPKDDLRVRSMRYGMLDNNETERYNAAMELIDSLSIADKSSYRLDAYPADYDIRTVPGRDPMRPSSFYRFPSHVSNLLDDLSLHLSWQFRGMSYVGPLRGYPERLYVWSGETPDNVGHRGERVVEALLARQHLVASLVEPWMRKLGLVDSLDVKRIAPGRSEYEIMIRTPKDVSDVNLTDAGFGLSQLLPVIVQCFYNQDSTVIFEQPEIHLHPSVQAGLADLFIAAIQRTEGPQPPNQIIVESHSEHFLHRLQRRLAEEAIHPEDVAIYFVERGSHGSSIRELEVDEYGNIRNWPDGFFGDEMGDRLAMMDAEMRRKEASA